MIQWQRLAGLLMLLFLPPTALAEHKPLWEVGAGLTLLNLPDYRGSDESRTYLLPYPYLIYRGDRLRLEGNSASGRLIDRERVKLDISLGGSLPVNSTNNKARRGMPDLDPAGEIGPQLKIVLSHDKVRNEAWQLNLPIRAVIATDFSSTHQEGWIFNPHLDYIRLFPGDPYDWRLVVSMGPYYATADYHDYLYSVPTRFAIPGERPAFKAEGGYSGTRLMATLGHNLNRNWLIGGFVRYDNLDGAAFEESPLVKTSDSWMMGVALTWVFSQSDEQAHHQEL